MSCILTSNFTRNLDKSELTGSIITDNTLCSIPDVNNADICRLHCSNYDNCKGFNYISGISSDTQHNDTIPETCTTPGISNNSNCCVLKGGITTTPAPSPSNGVSYSAYKLLPRADNNNLLIHI